MEHKNFQAWMVINKVTQAEIADLLRVDRSTINNKIHGRRGADFSAKEIKLICQKYNLSANEIFFA